MSKQGVQDLYMTLNFFRNIYYLVMIMKTDKRLNVILTLIELAMLPMMLITLGTRNFLLSFVCYFISVYLRGFDIARIDKRQMIAKDIKLSSFEKKILFPFEPNLFYRDTVIAQRIWVYYTALVLIVFIVTGDSSIFLPAIIIQIGLWFFLYFIFDFTGRKVFSGRSIEKYRKRQQRKYKKERQKQRAEKAEKKRQKWLEQMDSKNNEKDK